MLLSGGSFVFLLREKRINGSPYLGKPFFPLAFGARNNDAEHVSTATKKDGKIV